ncbi:FAD-dependent monooxygenase [Flammeovirgaceae bacterium SG7u.111]|nr:FAD-dependent monooxygenase [Flammeovirgaceae bacterium SG7u.132]WPO35529.1 FAD-dependent monooxygenase [Flammeovirgaceae bacterium SG7u.111]
MKKELTFTLPPHVAFDPEVFESFVKKKLKVSETDRVVIRQTRRSIDARFKKVKVLVQCEAFVNENATPLIEYVRKYRHVHHAPQVIIVGSGPAGLFAALRLLELGFKPIILERGSDVQARRRDLAAINKEHVVNPDSNYCFGEGGAGTYSDGKLYTRSKKRGDFRRILEIFVAHGATPEILVDAHPHIGTNKLPKIIEGMRESILNAGGEIHFNTRVDDFIVNHGAMKGVVTQNGDKLVGIGVILATGHSARDIFTKLHEREVLVEFKPFALGVRVEHQQNLIDSLQYHCESRGEYLPAAAYNLVTQTMNRGVKKGVFSFCMCPGGFIVPSATAPGEVVVNGMSPSRRDSKYANSGIVVPVEEKDIKAFAEFGPLAGMHFQAAVEQKACEIGGGTQAAPAQLLEDFVNKKVSANLLESSYQPGLTSADMNEVLPPDFTQRLRYGFKDFGRKMRGYLSNEAQIVGVESRTSSPVRIPRDRETYEHVQTKRLFPAGEGAGYAGGIASAAMDGERCAEKLVEMYGKGLV